MEAIDEIDTIKTYLESNPEIQLAWIFGSVAKGAASSSSDVDVAVRTNGSLLPEMRKKLIADIAKMTGRPVDLIDFSHANPVLKKQFMVHGQRVVNKDQNLYSESLKDLWFETQDWQPYRERILRERRKAWINS